MAIKQYSLKKDGKTYLAPCFQVKEFACRASDTILIDDELVVLLQCIREHFGEKVHITSGYRTAAYNATLPDASKNSQHIQGRAADFWVEGVPVAIVAAYAEKLLPGRWHRPLPEGRGAPDAQDRLGARGHPPEQEPVDAVR